jgi:hypothetical protein
MLIEVSWQRSQFAPTPEKVLSGVRFWVSYRVESVSRESENSTLLCQWFIRFHFHDMDEAVAISDEILEVLRETEASLRASGQPLPGPLPHLRPYGFFHAQRYFIAEGNESHEISMMDSLLGNLTLLQYGVRVAVADLKKTRRLCPQKQIGTVRRNLEQLV